MVSIPSSELQRRIVEGTVNSYRRRAHFSAKPDRPEPNGCWVRFPARVVVRTVISISGAGVFLLLPFACCSRSAIVWLGRQAFQMQCGMCMTSGVSKQLRVTVPHMRMVAARGVGGIPGKYGDHNTEPNPTANPSSWG